jgi:predicted HAD superfamily Cof-like phosphohydrolase
MTNPFRDQEKFMQACDQTVDGRNDAQFKLYYDLIAEEYAELNAAVLAGDRVEQLDALLDIIVVTVGAINSMGADGEGGWKEVMRTNFAKIDKETGKVRKREDGKVLKPTGWTPPDLTLYLNK